MNGGRHLKIMGKAHADALGSARVIREILLHLVETAGMRALGEPHIYEVECQLAKMNVEPFEDEGGVTGIVVLSTSHCAIHTWPLRNFFVLDLYSCRWFEKEPILSLLYQRLTDLHISKVLSLDCSTAE